MSAVSAMPCRKCDGAGFDDDGEECGDCRGSGHMLCEHRGCKAPAEVFDDDGRALCSDCFVDVCEDWS